MAHLFKVGDRVKLARASCPENVGLTGTIQEIRKFKKGEWVENAATLLGVTRGIVGQDCDCRVEWDGCSGLWAQDLDQLEPLNPPKSQIDEILAMRDLPDFEIGRVAA